MPVSFMFSKQEETPLHIACKEDKWDIETVKFLVEKGANVNVEFKVRFILDCNIDIICSVDNNFFWLDHFLEWTNTLLPCFIARAQEHCIHDRQIFATFYSGFRIR